MAAMNRQITFLFSGHGSQYLNMGRSLYDSEMIFRNRVEWGREIVIKKLGIDIIDSVFGTKENSRLDEAQFTHPALFLWQWAMVEVLQSRGIFPQAVLGASLGEVVSLCVAKILDFETAFLRVCEEALIFEKHCPRGGMTAILASPTLMEDHSEWFVNLDLAALSMKDNFAVSGPVSNLQSLEENLRHQNIVFQRLPVQTSFHSHYMEASKLWFESLYKDVAYAAPKIKFLSCSSPHSLPVFGPLTTWSIYRNPILLAELIPSLVPLEPMTFIDCGPSGTMATLLKYNLKTQQSGSSLFFTMHPHANSLQNLEKIVTFLGSGK